MILRVWDIHPGYLSRQSLLGQHVEIHAIFNIITGDKQGYAHHPETMRWRHNLDRLIQVHRLTVAEMILRGYGHASPLTEMDCAGEGVFSWVDPPHFQFGLLLAKYATKAHTGRIPLPQRGSQFWANHKYGVMGRGYGCYKEIQAYLRNKKDYPIEEEAELVARVMEITRSSLEIGALPNTLDHLWGYFKNSATLPEKEIYLTKREADPASLIPFFYQLACKYEIQYLRHSTIFSDII